MSTLTYLILTLGSTFGVDACDLGNLGIVPTPPEVTTTCPVDSHQTEQSQINQRVERPDDGSVKINNGF